VTSKLLVVAIASACAVLALAFVEVANSTTTGWQLAAKAVDRNSDTPDASIFSEEVFPGRQYRVVTQSTRPGNKLEWRVTCYIDYYNANYSYRSTSRGRAWPGRGKRTYAVSLPRTPETLKVIQRPGGLPPYVIRDEVDVNCYASVTLDAPWGRVRTLGVWLQERRTD
jgi:hypothetical protein